MLYALPPGWLSVRQPLMRGWVVQVKKADDSIGPAVEEQVKAMSNGEVT